MVRKLTPSLTVGPLIWGVRELDIFSGMGTFLSLRLRFGLLLVCVLGVVFENCCVLFLRLRFGPLGWWFNVLIILCLSFGVSACIIFFVMATIYRNIGKSARKLFHSIAGGVNHLLWPAVCGVCERAIPERGEGLWDECWGQLRFCTGGDHCPRCGRDASKYGLIDGRCDACQGSELHYDAIVRGGVYDRVLRNMILAFKFQDRMELSSHIRLLADSAFQGSSFAESIDCFVPVPLHWMRRLNRGYNQSMIICKGISGSQRKVNTDLVRIRNTERQWSLSTFKRKRNVKDAFAVRKGHEFAGRRICLIDDITTSGATLNECARTLKDAGADKVYALVVAVAASVETK